MLFILKQKFNTKNDFFKLTKTVIFEKALRSFFLNKIKYVLFILKFSATIESSLYFQIKPQLILIKFM